MSVANRKHKHVFIHVPKTGGTSMEQEEWVGGNGHATIAQLCRKAPREWLRWAFVRHPIDRAVSTYESFRQHGGPPSKDTQGRDFGQWVAWLCDDPSRPLKWAHTRPQVDFITIGGSIAVDFIGRFEQIEDHWRAISRAVGIPAPLPHKNPSKHKPWREYLADFPQAEQRLRWLYRRDFELLGY